MAWEMWRCLWVRAATLSAGTRSAGIRTGRSILMLLWETKSGLQPGKEDVRRMMIS